MLIRENMELLERTYLSPFATLSQNSRGRDREEPQCDIRPVFQRDRDRILHCKSFRRLKHKTQVFLTPRGDHYRTRLTHTLEVSQNARTIAKALRLNEDLVEAIALGHDLGHTPFGHAGEHMLNEICEGGFRHNEQSVRIVEKLEKDGQGLNLTWEVRDGMMNHQTRLMPSTMEGKIVRLSDKIAYINHDIDDSLRAGILTVDSLPKDCINILGKTSKERINFLIRNIINNSAGINDIVMESKVKNALYVLREFMFEFVYESELLENGKQKVENILSRLFYYYINNPDKLPEEFINHYNMSEDKNLAVCDYIAGMTDRFAVKIYSEIFKK